MHSKKTTNKNGPYHKLMNSKQPLQTTEQQLNRIKAYKFQTAAIIHYKDINYKHLQINIIKPY